MLTHISERYNRYGSKQIVLDFIHTYMLVIFWLTTTITASKLVADNWTLNEGMLNNCGQIPTIVLNFTTDTCNSYGFSRFEINNPNYFKTVKIISILVIAVYHSIIVMTGFRDRYQIIKKMELYTYNVPKSDGSGFSSDCFHEPQTNSNYILTENILIDIKARWFNMKKYSQDGITRDSEKNQFGTYWEIMKLNRKWREKRLLNKVFTSYFGLWNMCMSLSLGKDEGGQLYEFPLVSFIVISLIGLCGVLFIICLFWNSNKPEDKEVIGFYIGLYLLLLLILPMVFAIIIIGIIRDVLVVVNLIINICGIIINLF